MNTLVFAVLAITIDVTVSFEVHIQPSNRVVVNEYQDIEVNCELDKRITTNNSLDWNVIWKLSGTTLSSVGSFEPKICNHNVTTNNCTETVFMISCNKRTNSFKLKLYNVSSTKHGDEIDCILKSHGEIYRNTTSIYVQVPLKIATIKGPEERTIQCNSSIQLECKTSPSRPQANITWSVVSPAGNSRTRLVDSEEFYSNGSLTNTTSYLNYSTGVTQSKEIICEASNGISAASSNVTLKVKSCTVPYETTRPTPRRPTTPRRTTTYRPIWVPMGTMDSNKWLTTNNKWILIAAIITALLIFITVTSICFSKQCTTSYVQAGIAKTRRTLRRRGTSSASEGAGNSHPQNQNNVSNNNMRQPSNDHDDVYARIQPKAKQKKPQIEGQAPISLKSLVVVHSLSKNRAKSSESGLGNENLEKDERLNYIQVDLPENGNGEIHGMADRTVYTWVNMSSEHEAEKSQNMDTAGQLINKTNDEK